MLLLSIYVLYSNVNYMYLASCLVEINLYILCVSRLHLQATNKGLAPTHPRSLGWVEIISDQLRSLNRQIWNNHPYSDEAVYYRVTEYHVDTRDMPCMRTYYRVTEYHVDTRDKPCMQKYYHVNEYHVDTRDMPYMQTYYHVNEYLVDTRDMPCMQTYYHVNEYHVDTRDMQGIHADTVPCDWLSYLITASNYERCLVKHIFILSCLT